MNPEFHGLMQTLTCRLSSHPILDDFRQRIITKMRIHDALKSDEADDAAWEAGKGAVIGAAKWGAGAVMLGAIGYVWSPIYRATTVQFKV